MKHPVLPRRLRALGLLVAAVASLAIVSTVAPSATAGGGAVAVPPTPAGLPVAIEGLSPYVPPTGCDLRTRTGSAKLAKLIQVTYGNTYGLSRTCTSATTPSSEHFDGRAIDTFFNVRNATERAEASAVLTWLLAYDKAGNRYANARRLGVMYIIWNDKMWSSYRPAEGWRPYSTCADTPSSAYDTACHRNHIHLSLSWEGANGRTSFWTKTVAPVDWGPCRPADLNWSEGQAAPNPKRCTELPRRQGSGRSEHPAQTARPALGHGPASRHVGTCRDHAAECHRSVTGDRDLRLRDDESPQDVADHARTRGHGHRLPVDVAGTARRQRHALTRWPAFAGSSPDLLRC